MVDSLSRSPSPVNTPGRVSPTSTPAGQLSQGPASRSQSPGTTSLVSRGRNARAMPDLQQGAAPVRTRRAATPHSSSRRPSAGGVPEMPPLPSNSSLMVTSVSHPVMRRSALDTWAANGAGERRQDAVTAINAARNQQGRILDLSNLGLTSLPEGLGRLLPSVQNLSLGGNRLTSLAALAEMRGLVTLDVTDNPLNSLHSLPALPELGALFADGAPLHEPDAGLLDRQQLLFLMSPVSAFTDAQHSTLRRRLLEAGVDGDWSMDTVEALREDQNSHQTPSGEAAMRWGSGRPSARAEHQARYFSEAVMPKALHRQLQADPASRGLLTLIAGMVFTSDNDPDVWRPIDAPPSASKITLTADLNYLLKANDATLRTDCQNAADDAVNHCGDRVSYGATQLHQVIEAHQFKTGQLSAKALFEGKARHFNQRLVEAKAEEIAGSGIRHESIEYYQNLAAKVAAKGRPLVEAGTGSLYGHLYSATPQQVQETLELIDAKNHNPAYLDTFKDNEATVNEVLRTVFSSDYASMREQRSALEDKESDAMFDPTKSAAEQLEAGVRLGELGQRENQWYASKLPELLNSPELLAKLK